MSLLTDERTIVETQTTSDKGSATHMVWMPPEIQKEYGSPQAYVMYCRVEGVACRALCGYVWIPNKNPENHPICQECKHIYETMGGIDKDERKDKLPDA